MADDGSTEEAVTGDNYFTLAVSKQGEGKGEDALELLDKAEVAWKSEGKLGGDTPYAKALLEMREKIQSTGQKEEDPVQAALLKSVNEVASKAEKALAAREVQAARAAYDEATQLFESDATLEDKDTSIMLREMGQKVKFAEWKLQAEANSERSDKDWAEVDAMRRAKKEAVKAEVDKLRTGDSAAALRSEAKDRADTAFSIAEQLVEQGDMEGAREQLAVAEEGWGQAGLLNFPGKPFEAAIEGVMDKIQEKEAA